MFLGRIKPLFSYELTLTIYSDGLHYTAEQEDWILRRNYAV